MPDPLKAISTRVTPQSEQADPRQLPNNAGGYGFQVTGDARLHRFLTLGTEGGTYYASERAITRDFWCPDCLVQAGIPFELYQDED